MSAPLDLDDRMALAIAAIDAQLTGIGLMPLTALECVVLRDPYGYRPLITFLQAVHTLPLDEPLALLAEWHAWHGGH